MRVTKEKTVKYVIELDAFEAHILKGLVQNPPSEDKDIQVFCKRIFESLPTYNELEVEMRI
jgi:hypothetical protein